MNNLFESILILSFPKFKHHVFTNSMQINAIRMMIKHKIMMDHFFLSGEMPKIIVAISISVTICSSNSSY